MKRINYLTLFWLVMAIMMVSCNDDKEIGIAEQSWTEGEIFEISTQQDVTVRFTAYSKWVASVVNGGDWCKLSQTAGDKGSHSFIVSVTGETTTERTATINIQTEDSPASSFQVIQRAGEDAEDAVLNREVDKYLNEMYLWNEEYKGLTKNFNQGYEEFFYGNLMNMNTNTLDKRFYSDGRYHLFSYIVKQNTIESTRATTEIEREQEYSFGFTGMIGVRLGEAQASLCIKGTYPKSPAAENEVGRGAFLYKMNGKEITPNNWQQVFTQLMLPESATTVTVTEIETDEEGNFQYDKNGKLCTRDITLTARAMYKNPVLHHEVITSDNGRKIGYLVYDNFDAGFDDVLFDVFKEFKSEGIQDLVLDLRYNGGGHVISANLIASCVAGSSCRNQVFVKYRYNEERMKKLSSSSLEEKFYYSWYANLKTSLAAGDLGLKRLYCLVGENTASASELVINSLKGIDIQVTLIGEQTTGKNVGMEPKEITVGSNIYKVVPITFQSYNAKGEGEYADGFKPDIPLNEVDADGDGYFDNFLHFGHPDEPLLARAIQEITGTRPSNTRSLEHTSAKGKAYTLPTLQRPGHYGMIK